jgi:hypothetical protein
MGLVHVGVELVVVEERQPVGLEQVQVQGMVLVASHVARMEEHLLRT